MHTLYAKSNILKISYDIVSYDKSGICLLIAPVPVHCFSLTSIKIYDKWDLFDF